MHSRSFLSILVLVGSWGAALAHGQSKDPVVVWVTRTTTICPSPPPPPSCFERGTLSTVSTGHNSHTVSGTGISSYSYTSSGSFVTVSASSHSYANSTWTVPHSSASSPILSVPSSGPSSSRPPFGSNSSVAVSSSSVPTSTYLSSSTLSVSVPPSSSLAPSWSPFPTNSSASSTSSASSASSWSALPTNSSISSSFSSLPTSFSTVISSSSRLSVSSALSTSNSSSSTIASSSSSSTATSSTISSTPSSTCGSFFLEKLKHQGVAPYAGSDYIVFRNVQDFGAKGDGVTDDTAAINRAISATSNGKNSSDQRCGPNNCQSTTTQPAVVYFPAGTYVVSAPIIDFYLTQLIGDPLCVPVIKAAADFQGIGSQPYSVVDGDLQHKWQPVNVFWRQIRNFVIDTTAVPASVQLAGIHWATGQATSLQNIVFRLSSANGTQHQGVYSEEGSGGFLTDLVFYGGQYGLNFGNQQYTMRNLTFFGCQTAVRQLWNWSWLYKGVHVHDCAVGLDLTAGAPDASNVDVVVVVDSDFTNVTTAVKIGRVDGVKPGGAGQLILENVDFSEVGTAVKDVSGHVVLAGSTSSVDLYGVGAGYEGQTPINFTGSVGHLQSARPAGLVDGRGRFYERSKPQYADLPVSAFVSARDAGAAGDGTTDDTVALQVAILETVAAGQVLFIDHGIYVVTDTLIVPPGARIVGEGLPVILSSGPAFDDVDAPRAVLQIGVPGSVGTAELSDLVVSTRGAQAGAILIQWHLSGPEGLPPTASGLWDVHTRVGGFAGSQQQLADCPLQNGTHVTAETIPPQCIAAFASLHVSASASRAYFENVWLWVADHDIEDATLRQISVYAGRGALLEGRDLLLYGTAAEHHVLYQYHVHGAQDVVLGLIQTETAYYQPNPDATVPFYPDPGYSDPSFGTGDLGWGALYTGGATGIHVYGAGHYSFFRDNDKACEQYACQTSIVRVEAPAQVTIFGLATTGATYMLNEDGVVFAPANETRNNGNFVGVVGVYAS